LDEEVDSSPPPELALLPAVLSFLSSFPQYLDIVVQCTRKTEARSWRTLFTYLPPPAELFEESLQRGSLKTAGGYLLVLHTFEELSSSSDQLVRLLARAMNEGDWELCKELARFLAALDETGDALREALRMVDLRSPSKAVVGSPLPDGLQPKVSGADSNEITNISKDDHRRSSSSSNQSSIGSPTDPHKL
jgi:RAB6A-GEF complex partner protein 1